MASDGKRKPAKADRGAGEERGRVRIPAVLPLRHAPANATVPPERPPNGSRMNRERTPTSLEPGWHPDQAGWSGFGASRYRRGEPWWAWCCSRPSDTNLRGPRRQRLGVSDTSDVIGSVVGRPSSTRSAPPIPPTADLGVAPGQPDRWSLNQWWKVRMLAGWERESSTITLLSSQLIAVDLWMERRLAHSQVSVPSPEPTGTSPTGRVAAKAM
jgi:hypothetical protein